MGGWNTHVPSINEGVTGKVTLLTSWKARKVHRRSRMPEPLADGLVRVDGSLVRAVKQLAGVMRRKEGDYDGVATFSASILFRSGITSQRKNTQSPARGISKSTVKFMKRLTRVCGIPCSSRRREQTGNATNDNCCGGDQHPLLLVKQKGARTSGIALGV